MTDGARRDDVATDDRGAGSFLDTLRVDRNLSKEARRAVDAEIAAANLKRARVILPVVLLLHAMGYWAGLAGAPAGASESTREWLHNLWLLHAWAAPCNAAMFALAFLRAGPNRAWLARLQSHVGTYLAVFYVIWAPLVSGNAQRARPNLDVFSMALMGTAALVLTPSAVMLAAQGVSAAIIIAAIVHFVPMPAMRRSAIVNVVGTTAAAALLSRLLYASFARSFIDRRTILHQKNELEALNRDLAKIVEAKVAEALAKQRKVDELDVQLRERVRERAKELSQTLAQLDAERERRESGLYPGRVLGDRVELVRPIAKGGMGAVFEARDLATDSAVAVKVIQAAASSDAESLHRFLREGFAAASVDHPAVVRTVLVDVSDDGLLFQVQELVRGASLASVLEKRGKLPVAHALRIASVLLDALHAAHAAGVVHRDIKPSNVMLSRDAPGLRLLDFGVSKMLTDLQDQSLTMTGNVIGTPEYLSPEQVTRPDHVTERADVYSAALVLYRMLTGTSPYDADSVMMFLSAHASARPRSLSERLSNADPALVALMDRCLAKEPGDRPSAGELAASFAHMADEAKAPTLEAIASGYLARDEGDEGATRNERVRTG